MRLTAFSVASGLPTALDASPAILFAPVFKGEAEAFRRFAEQGHVFLVEAAHQHDAARRKPLGVAGQILQEYVAVDVAANNPNITSTCISTRYAAYNEVFYAGE